MPPAPHLFYPDEEILHLFNAGFVIDGTEDRLCHLIREHVPRMTDCRDTDLERERNAQLDYSKP